MSGWLRAARLTLWPWCNGLAASSGAKNMLMSTWDLWVGSERKARAGARRGWCDSSQTGVGFPDTQHATVGARPQPKDTHSDTGSHASPRALRRCGGEQGSRFLKILNEAVHSFIPTTCERTKPMRPSLCLHARGDMVVNFVSFARVLVQAQVRWMAMDTHVGRL